MARHHSLRERQRGAVALIVGLLSVLFLFGMMGIAIDLSYLYARKTELQNAADAAALSGAKDLNQTAAGVNNAVASAIATFGQNAANNLIHGEAITADNLRFGSCANADDHLPVRAPSCTFVDATTASASDSAAASLTFIEVDTGAASNKPVFFMPVIGGQDNASASGYAVAGRYLAQVTPIGICAVTTTRFDSYAHGELLEYGFRRGISYDLMSMGPLGANSIPYLVNPVDTDPATCDPYHSSANFTAPFVCMGSSAVGQGAGTVFAIGNTGLSNVIVSALNSRFGLYGGAGWGTNQCDPQSAPPDRNVKQFCYRTQGNKCDWQPNASWVPSGVSVHSDYGEDPDNAAAWNVANEQAYQPVQLNSTTKKPCYNASPGGTGSPGNAFVAASGCGSLSSGPNYGTLWAYGPAYRANLSAPDGTGAAYTAAEANAIGQMYNNSATAMRYFDTAVYPATSPYSQTSGPFFQAPPSALGVSGVANRRIINILIIDCDNVTGGGACGMQLPVLGIGRFFMTVMSDPTGSPKRIPAEFAGLANPVPLAEIKLYR
ncbi:pilus assembly protein TadG-related protein [Azospira restricta]|uniref:Putative Flp pilus-assembly TadG-like N-terminal domain-containing protein n=1 Tax=Azospira restricta TaxID=404405 RepID=A0A974SN54_9RHOO|nr:pilus assembly protein TadG-related protein [Azospira restricta]QRJ62919.1 hypothetical protein IWH25_14305 [Azospira restricta]